MFRRLLLAFAGWELLPAAGVSLIEGVGPPAAAGAAGDDPDGALVMTARDGDTEAFEAIVRKYQGPAFNIALRMLSDREEARDVVQDVFIKVYRSLRSYRAESRFAHWFYAVLLNACRSKLKHLKSRGFFRTRPLDDPGPGEDGPPRQYADDAPGAADLVEREQTGELVRRAVARVPAVYREVLVLRDIQGFAYEEAAAALGIDVGTVKSRLHRGRLALKDILEKEMGN